MGVPTWLGVVSLFCWLGRTIGSPASTHVDWNRLETYEDFSGQSAEDTDLLGKLRFRFSCQDKPVGLYADPDYHCRIFHMCESGGEGLPVLCPDRMSFDQKRRICTDVENVDCSFSREWYPVNEISYPEEEYKDEDQVPSVRPLTIS